MFELGPIQWFFLGVTVAGAVIVACMLLGACAVSSWWSRLEEKRENSMKVENWKATPERLAMTKREH